MSDLQHCILVKYNDTVTDEKKEDLYLEIRDLFDGLTAIDGIHSVKLLKNVINRPNRYDLLIRSSMDDTVLPMYDDSAIHKKWKNDYAEYLEKKAIFDYRN